VTGAAGGDDSDGRKVLEEGRSAVALPARQESDLEA